MEPVPLHDVRRSPPPMRRATGRRLNGTSSTAASSTISVEHARGRDAGAGEPDGHADDQEHDAGPPAPRPLDGGRAGAHRLHRPERGGAPARAATRRPG